MKVIILIYVLLLAHMTQCRGFVHVIGAPTRCPQGYRHDYSGRCRKVFFWNRALSKVSTKMKFGIYGDSGLRVEKAHGCLRSLLIYSEVVDSRSFNRTSWYYWNSCNSLFACHYVPSLCNSFVFRLAVESKDGSSLLYA
jgi:hypothetical protein